MGALKLTYSEELPTLKVVQGLFSSLEKSCARDYRYGFNGQEKDNEIKGQGNSINFKFRMHDPRLGRFLSIDPLSGKYPYYTPYSFSGNRVIDMIELEGAEPTSPKYLWAGTNGYENLGYHYGDGSVLSKVEGWWVYENIDSEGKTIHMFWTPKDGVWKNFTPQLPKPLAPVVTDIAITLISIPAAAVSGAIFIEAIVVVLPEFIVAAEAAAVETAFVTQTIVNTATEFTVANPKLVGAAIEFVLAATIDEPLESPISSGSLWPSILGQGAGFVKTFIEEDKIKDLEGIFGSDDGKVSLSPPKKVTDIAPTDATSTKPIMVSPLKIQQKDPKFIKLNNSPTIESKKEKVSTDDRISPRK